MARVLLVEDEADVRDLIEEAFAERGLVVRSAASDLEAYGVLDEEARSFSVLVADINLGAGTTGFDVARAARVIQPGLAVIYMTAFDIETRAHAVPESLTLRKPLRVSELAGQILDYLNADGVLDRDWDSGAARASAG